MPIDPRIPLQFNATQQMGPDWAGAMQGARSAWQVDAYRRDAQGLDATKKVFSDPASLDKDGNPTPEAMRQVMTASPEVGMKLRENVLLSQERQLRTEVLKSEAYQKKSALQNDVVLAATDAYEESQHAGDPPEVSQQKAQKALTEGMNGLRASGGFSPDEQRGWKSEFNYKDAKNHLMMDHNYRAWVAEQRKQDEDARKADLAQRNADRADQRLEQQGWVVQEDPSHPDEKGNPTPYRYNAGLAQYTDIDGKPLSWKPGGAQKVGTEKKVTPNDKSEAAAMRIKKGLVEQFTKDNGRAPNDFEDAQLEQQARNYKSVELTRSKDDLLVPAKGPALDKAAKWYHDTHELMPGYGGAAARKAIMDREAEMYPGTVFNVATMADVKADRGSLNNLQKQRDAATAYSKTADKEFDNLLGAIPKTPEPLNMQFLTNWVRTGSRQLGGTQVPVWNVYLVSALDEYAKVIAGATGAAGSTDASRAQAATLIPEGSTSAQIKQIVPAIKQGLKNRTDGYDTTISEIQRRLSDEPAPGRAGQAAPSDADRAYLKANPDKKALFIKRFGQSEADKVLGQ